MKFVKIMCLCKLAYVSSTPFRSGVSIDCKTQRQNIEIEALEAALEKTSPAWRIPHDNFGIPERVGCRKLTWDQSYCTRVCQLESGDECVPGTTAPGDDRCHDDLICTKTGSTHTCQSPVEYSYEDSDYDLIYGDSSWLSEPELV